MRNHSWGIKWIYNVHSVNSMGIQYIMYILSIVSKAVSNHTSTCRHHRPHHMHLINLAVILTVEVDERVTWLNSPPLPTNNPRTNNTTSPPPSSPLPPTKPKKQNKKQKHTAASIRWSSPTQLLVSRSEAYLWLIEREAELSPVYGRMCPKNSYLKICICC